MTKKQKHMLVRIAAAFVMLAVMLVVEHSGIGDRIQPVWLLAMVRRCASSVPPSEIRR